ADERGQVVLAQRVERDVTHHHHLVVAGFEHGDQVFGGVLVEAGADLGIHASHPGGGVEQTVSVGVFTDGGQDLANGSGDAWLVDAGGLLVWVWGGLDAHAPVSSL